MQTTYSPDGRRWSTPRNHDWGRSLRDSMMYRQKYENNNIPDWIECDSNNDKSEKWWIKKVGCLEQISHDTFRSTLEDGLNYNRVSHDSHDPYIDYNRRLFLREIDIRGLHIQKEILGRWKSPLNFKCTTTHPVKSAYTICCGGGGGSGIGKYNG